MAKNGRQAHGKARDGIDRDKAYSIEEAVKLIKGRAKAKFDETIEVAMNLGVDPSTPTSSCVAFAICRTARAVRRASPYSPAAPRPMRPRPPVPTSSVRRIWSIRSKGTINFDRCIATPDMMGLVGRLGKVLGPAA